MSGRQLLAMIVAVTVVVPGPVAASHGPGHVAEEGQVDGDGYAAVYAVDCAAAEAASNASANESVPAGCQARGEAAVTNEGYPATVGLYATCSEDVIEGASDDPHGSSCGAEVGEVQTPTCLVKVGDFCYTIR